ncbi:MAG: sigma-70 family RNA polymerase sigma factor [FCB group bacterium]|nr:sigma-70 family RNA polymerase sigma factor [FCB group bacterium]
MSTNDLDLGWRWVTRRDAGAFQALVARHAGMVYGTCRRVLGNATEAEDVAQECFEILARTPKWPEGSLGAWLHRVATNRCLNRLKSERRRVDREERYVRERAPHAESEWDDIYRYVDEAIAALPDKYRIPLIACFYESQSHAAIAESLGIPRRTVTYRIDKGVEHIRESLRKRGLPVAAASLVAMLGANLAEAAPASLTASLGKLALAGVKATGGLAPKWLAVGGALAMWQKISLVIVGIALLLLFGHWLNRPDLSGNVVQSDANFEATRALAAPVFSSEQSIAKAKSAIASAIASEGQPAPAEPSASVRGTIIDDSGYPVPGALIRLEVADELGFDLRGLYRDVTDANGDFALDGICQFGHEKVYAHRDGYLQAVSAELSLRPCAEPRNVRLVLKKARYLVSGWVVDTSRRPIENAEVSLRHYRYKWPSGGAFYSGGAKLSSTFTDAKGWFVIGVPNSADCDFTVAKEGFGTGFFRDIGTGTEDAVFVLKPGGGISGKVIGKDGSPFEGAVLRAEGRADLSGEPEGFMPAQIRPPQVVTDANGNYRIDGLGADYTYRINLEKDSVPGYRAEPKTGIAVVSDRTTPDVDVILQPVEAVRIHGRVTDIATNRPAYPIALQIGVINAGNDFMGDTSATASTDSDGRYELSLQVTRPVDVRAQWCYTDGTNIFPKSPVSGHADKVEVKVFRGLQPGQDETLDFTVAAPVTAPLRFVDPAGTPIEGIEIVRKQGEGTWGTFLRSGNDGRAVYRGLDPDTTIQLEAVVTEPERLTVGESEPFAGRAGETLPEMTVVCRVRGGVNGVLVDASGQPVANTEIGCTAVRDDGTPVSPATATTSEDGTFVLFPGLPEDRYQTVAVGYERNGMIEVGLVQDVEISAGTAIDLGTVRCEPMISTEEAVQAAQAMQDAE